MSQKAKVHDPVPAGFKVGKLVMASPEELDSLDVDKPIGEFTFNSQNLTLKGKVWCRKGGKE